MAHDSHSDLKRQSHKDRADKLRHLARGGSADAAEDKKMIEKAMREHEAHDHPGTAPTKLKLKSGGTAEGEKAKKRLDRPGKRDAFAHGGAAKKHGKGKGTNVNVIVAPGAGGDRPVPVPVPVGGPPGGPVPGMAAPRPMPAPGPGPVGMPPGAGGPPPGLPPGLARKDGGSVMKAGARSVLGRLEKIEAYGKKAHGDLENEPVVPRKRGGKC